MTIKMTTSYGADKWVDLSLFQSIVDIAELLDFASLDESYIAFMPSAINLDKPRVDEVCIKPQPSLHSSAVRLQDSELPLLLASSLPSQYLKTHDEVPQIQLSSSGESTRVKEHRRPAILKCRLRAEVSLHRCEVVWLGEIRFTQSAKCLGNSNFFPSSSKKSASRPATATSKANVVGALSSQPISTFPENQAVLRTLSRSAQFEEAEEALTAQILPKLRTLSRQSHRQCTYATGLVEYQSRPCIMVVVDEPDRLAGCLDSTYGGLAVVVLKVQLARMLTWQTEPLVISCGNDQQWPYRIHAASLAHHADFVQWLYAPALGPPTATFVDRFRTKPIRLATWLCLRPVTNDWFKRLMCEVSPSRDTRPISQQAPLVRALPAQFEQCRIVSPADDDLALMLKELEADIAKWQAELVWYETDPQKWRSADLRREHIAIAQSQHDVLKRQHGFGMTIAGHFHLPERGNRYYSDCALIQLTNPTKITVRSNLIGPGGKYCEGFIDPELLVGREELFKIGRSSGLTTASLNGYKLIAAMNTPFGVAEEVPSYAMWKEDYQNIVSQPGDSGAAVIWAEHSMAVGLLFGGVMVEVETKHGRRVVDSSLFQNILDIAQLLDIEPLVD
ncbi:hypothetical protein BCR37DRAFT_388409 [Protomyces lactucae-debilis]|uniref:Uncharacterized protein n=1 Tax=Protomyces lactucae-debilis TaxID=2754530 RepID=A0A1Y2FB18_PROLT|nr:uncharacterized protein BCR37DRAFT_388409 [Protomyces lactucae-debilis]ORY80055.1 hypothetical protein BCR37DRAFT_388409 [Protomyces lactucae-debilis]